MQRAEQYGPFPDGFVMVPHCLEYRAQWDVANYGERAADAIETARRVGKVIVDMGDMAEVPALPAITKRPDGLEAAIQLGFDTELALGQKYEGWYRAATSEMTRQHLLQFLEIQRKSIGEYGDWLARIERAAGDECGLLIIDKELGGD